MKLELYIGSTKVREIEGEDLEALKVEGRKRVDSGDATSVNVCADGRSVWQCGKHGRGTVEIK